LVGVPLDVRCPPTGDQIDAVIAASRTAELIVLGCRHGARNGIGIGAAVHPVAELAHCDVVMVGGRADAVRSINRRVSVLIGGSADADECAVRAACRIALLRNTPVEISRLAHRPVVRNRSVSTSDDLAPVQVTIDLARGLAPTVSVSARLVWAKPHEAVAGIADTDLLVVGADGPLDSLAQAALHHARSPVLVAHVRRPTASEPERAARSATAVPHQTPRRPAAPMGVAQR
jgi:hypothetical protein